MQISARPANSGWSLLDALVALLVLTLALLLAARFAGATTRAVDSDTRVLQEQSRERESALEELDAAIAD